MKTLKISKEISLPNDYTTQVTVILAKRRVGKSYAMRKIAEELLEDGQQVVMVDPKGDQWGIRSSADGKKPGYPVVILGGEHGDAPLEVNAGEVVAKLVVEERVSILLDLSIFRKHEIATFMTAFLENLYRLKAREEYRTPVKLVVDEADAIAPQKPQKGEERMLGAIEDIVRRGGQRGIGCDLVTQRSAVLNKNVLTQAQMLIVLRTIAPQDLAAMKAWIDVHGTAEEGKTLMDSLPSLPIGDAWFWSPGWPTDKGIFQRSHILPIKTFDSGATPAPGEKKIVPKNLADVDLEALKKQMSATIEKAKNDNPSVLRRKIVELERELLAKPKIISNKLAGEDIKRAVDIAVSQEVRKWSKEIKAKDKIISDYRHHFQSIHQMTEKVLNTEIPVLKLDLPPLNLGTKPVIAEQEPHVNRNILEESEEDKPLSKGARSILSYLHSVYPESRSKTQMWVATGYSPGGGFNNCIYELTGAGLISNQGNRYVSTERHDADVTNENFVASLDLWKQKLALGPRKILDLLLEDPTTPMTKEDIAQATGYALGGGFNNNIYALTGAELIIKIGMVYAINPEILNL